jgi:hypothetical protein
MTTVHELAEFWHTFFENYFEMLEKIVGGLQEAYEAIIEIAKAFENENPFQNRRLHMPIVIDSLNKESLFPSCHVPRRTGRRMGGRMGQ